MQPSRFMVLTGHLNDYPLPDLVGILRHQQKTGRLLIEFAKAPAIFFFKDGELVDVQMEKLVGLQALCVALAEAPASFNFNPLIQPSRRSIQPSFQKAVSELLGSWDENALETEKIVEPNALPAQERPALPAASFHHELEGPVHRALTFSSVPEELPARRYSPSVVTMAASGLLMLGLSAFIGTTGNFGTSASSTPPPSVSIPTATDVRTKLEGVQTSVVAHTVRRSEMRLREAAKNSEKRAVAEESNRKSAPEGSSSSQAKSTENATTNDQAEAKADSTSSKVRSVKVLLQIDNGLVSGASIGNHKPGMDAYEALALRIARQRRYPSKSGQETVMIKVQPE